VRVVARARLAAPRSAGWVRAVMRAAGLRRGLLAGERKAPRSVGGPEARPQSAEPEDPKDSMDPEDPKDPKGQSCTPKAATPRSCAPEVATLWRCTPKATTPWCCPPEVTTPEGCPPLAWNTRRPTDDPRGLPAERRREIYYPLDIRSCITLL
jgi:hypothetical protein